MRVLNIAADQGDPEAQAQLGDQFLLGEGVPQNCLEAYRWYWKSAQQGNIRAGIFWAFLKENLMECYADDQFG